MMDPFDDLIHQLGLVMGIPLHSDEHQSCLINFEDTPGLAAQIDLDATGDRLLIGSQLGTLDAGSYRESVLFTALRINGMSTIKHGILAFSEKNDALVLYQHLPLAGLDGEKLHSFLLIFLEHARIWMDAISHQNLPQIEESFA